MYHHLINHLLLLDFNFPYFFIILLFSGLLFSYVLLLLFAEILIITILLLLIKVIVEHINKDIFIELLHIKHNIFI